MKLINLMPRNTMLGGLMKLLLLCVFDVRLVPGCVLAAEKQISHFHIKFRLVKHKMNKKVHSDHRN